MESYTRRSIVLANEQDYLDRLSAVYPLIPDNVREIDTALWKRIEAEFTRRNDKALFKALLRLDLFPVKDGYVPYFRHYRGFEQDRIIAQNPETVSRICSRVYEIGLETLYERCSQPKETNRQMGPMFKNWISKKKALGICPTTDIRTFLNTPGFAILDGSDSFLGDFARNYLGWSREDKGLDFVAKKNDTFIIGEAKFITDFGGHQNDQFLDALTTCRSSANDNVVKVAIIDGVPYIPNRGKLYKSLIDNSEGLNILSALLLTDFINDL